jgi:hypothetical protein
MCGPPEQIAQAYGEPRSKPVAWRPRRSSPATKRRPQLRSHYEHDSQRWQAEPTSSKHAFERTWIRGWTNVVKVLFSKSSQFASPEDIGMGAKQDASAYEANHPRSLR